MGWNELLLLVAICVLQRVNGQGCQCDNAVKESKYPNTPVLVMSPTTDKSFPDEDNACFMDSGTCEVPVAYTGAEGNAMGFEPSISDCERMGHGNVTVVNDAREVLETITDVDCTSGRPLSQLPSRFTVIFSQTKDIDTDAMVFVLFLQPTIAATTTTTTTTTTPARTTTYSGNMTNDPTTFEIDLAVAIDSAYISDSRLYKIMKQFVRHLVDSLQVHNNADAEGGSRLSLASLGAKQGGLIGSPWAFEKEDFQMMALSVPMGLKNTAAATYTKAITEVMESAFTVKKENPSRSRKHAQRVLVVIAAQDSVKENEDDSFANRMDELDVWPILVKFSNSEFTYAENTLKRNKKDVLAIYDYKSGDVKSEAEYFFENYILRGSSLCGNLTGKGNFKVDDPYVITTAHYNDIKEGEQTDGQSGRYCNYQNENVTVKSFTGGQKIKLRVVYELEVEQDYLRIYDDKGNEQAAFTGFDVKGSEICFETNSFRVYFTTNQKNVYGGFKIEAAVVTNCAEKFNL